MSSPRFRLALPCATLLLLGGCAAVPVAQLAAQAISTHQTMSTHQAMSTQVTGPEGPSGEEAQAPAANGLAQAAHGLQGMLQRVTGP
jgi:hypothetical protein